MQSDTMSGELNVTRNGGVTGTSAPQYSDVNIELQTSNNNVPGISFHRGGYSATTLYEYNGELYVNAWVSRNQTGKLVSFGNDGSGSGLDADTVDGIQGASFLRSDASDTASGQITFTSTAQYPVIINASNNGKLVLRGSSSPYIRFQNGSTDQAFIQSTSSSLELKNQADSSSIRIKDAIDFSQDGTTYYSMWHAGNDGSGSGLDADTVDSYQYTNHEGVGDYQVFTVNGDTDKYYPVVITGGAGHSSDFKIWRGYNELGPDDWNTSTHKTVA